ncbi:hypothetical protein Tco_0768420 [Tanacetum coccineum]
MPLTYQDHSLRERLGLGTMKHTKLKIQKSSSKSVSGPITVCDTEPVTSSVPTEVKNNDQESKIDELTKLSESSKSVNSSKMSEDFKSNGFFIAWNANVMIIRSDHNMYVASLKSSENYKAQPYQYVLPSKHILKAKAKPFPPCTNGGFNDHRPDDCRNYPECEICGSYDHFTSGHNYVILVR